MPPFLLGLLLLFSACTRTAQAPEPPLPPEEGPGGQRDAVDPRPGPYAERARSLIAALDDRALAAQVIMSGIDGNGALSPLMKKILEEVRPGGVILFRYNLDTDKETLRRYMEEVSGLIAAGPPGLPPLIAVDHEGGQVHRFGPGVGRLPAPAAYWETARRQGRSRALSAVRRGAREAAAELRGLGITVNLAPVAELLSPENLPFLGDRSYGPDPVFTEAAARAFIQAMEEEGVLCVVKHFPGNTGSDPHQTWPVLKASAEDLDRLIRPFAALLRRNPPPALMVSHLRVAARDPDRPASLSPGVIREWIRGELGFSGMILADDFSMEAVAAGMDEEEAVVAALNAGVDMVITWPSSLLRVHRAILRAVDEGRLSRERLREAALRIRAAGPSPGVKPAG